MDRKYERYLPSYHSLTPDERSRIESKHAGFGRFMHDLRVEMGKMLLELQKALSVSSQSGSVLQVESLDDTLKLVRFP